MNAKKMRLCERILNIVLDILIFIFGIILLISIYNGIQKKILGNKYSSFFGYSIFEVQTGSMVPAINPGDWIIVRATNIIQLDDIITYEEDGEYITHRVREMYKDTYVTKGDANPVKDKPITDDKLVGKVEKVLPYFGIFRRTLFNPFVLITLIITVYLCSFAFRKNKKNEPEMKEDATKKIDAIVEKIIDRIKKIIKKDKTPKEKKVKENPKQEKAKKKNQATSAVKPIEEEKEDVKEDSKKEDVKYEQIETQQPEEAYEVGMIDIEPINEEDLDKTMYFRAIKVDKSELDDTFLEIEKNRDIADEVEEKERLRLEKKKAKELEKMEEPEEIDESLIKDSLEMLQNKNNRRFKNILDKIMYIKECELNEIVTVLNNEEKLAVNESTIKNGFIKAYIGVKYYNYCGDHNAEYNNRNMTIKIVDTIKEFSDKMVNNYKGPDKEYEEKVKKYTNIFILVMYLEQANGKIDDIEPIREMYKKKITKYFKNEDINEKSVKEMISEIIKIQRLHQGMIKYSMKKLETNTFILNYNQITPKKQLYALDLEHNIAFSKVYSDYIVDKTYSEGIIAEDKVTIAMTLVSMQLINDMLESDFRKKYILYVPESLYIKENKLNKLLTMMEDEYAKNNLILLVKFEDLMKNIKLIKELRKKGYRFALVFDETVEIKTRERNNINVVDYIFMDKKTIDTEKILPNIPEELINEIIYEDIGSKIGNYGGE